MLEIYEGKKSYFFLIWVRFELYIIKAIEQDISCELMYVYIYIYIHTSSFDSLVQPMVAALNM